MEIIIGRKAETNQLKITIGKQAKVCGTEQSVPNSVSRTHFSLTSVEGGGFTLKNLNPANETFVNGVSVESKHVTQQDKIELGAARYVFDWGLIAEVSPVLIDISPLRHVWDEYHREKMKIQVQQGRFNALKSLSGLLSMGAMAAMFFESNKEGSSGISMRMVLYGIGALFTLVVLVISFINASKIPQKQDEIDQRFRRRYVCPNPKCRHFMGNQPYDVLAQGNACPYCRAQYKEK
jgi:hypothetical protein